MSINSIRFGNGSPPNTGHSRYGALDGRANGAASTSWSIDSVLNLLFRCPHRRLTRPVTPIDRNGKPHGDTYVVCLACGKQFSYDLKEMRIGKPVPSSAEFGVLAPGVPGPRKSKIKLTMGLAVPFGIIIGSVLSSLRKHATKQPEIKEQ